MSGKPFISLKSGEILTPIRSPEPEVAKGVELFPKVERIDVIARALAMANGVHEADVIYGLPKWHQYRYEASVIEIALQRWEVEKAPDGA